MAIKYRLYSEEPIPTPSEFGPVETLDFPPVCKFLKMVMNFQRKLFLFLVFLKIIDKSLTITIYEDLWGYKIQWYVKRGGAQSFTYFCPLKVDLCQDMNVEGFAFSM